MRVHVRERVEILIFSLELFMMLYFFKGGRHRQRSLPSCFFYSLVTYLRWLKYICTFGKGRESPTCRRRRGHTRPFLPATHPFIYYLLIMIRLAPDAAGPALGPAAP